MTSAFDQEAVDFRAEGNTSFSIGGRVVSTGQDLDFGEQDHQCRSAKWGNLGGFGLKD